MGKDDKHTYTNSIANFSVNSHPHRILRLIVNLSDEEAETSLFPFRNELNELLINLSLQESSISRADRRDLILFLFYRVNVVDLHMGVANFVLSAGKAKLSHIAHIEQLKEELNNPVRGIFFRRVSDPEFVTFNARLNRLRDLTKRTFSAFEALQKARNRFAHPLFNGNDDISMLLRGGGNPKEVHRVLEEGFLELRDVKELVIVRLTKLFPGSRLP